MQRLKNKSSESFFSSHITRSLDNECTQTSSWIPSPSTNTFYPWTFQMMGRQTRKWHDEWAVLLLWWDLTLIMGKTNGMDVHQVIELTLTNTQSLLWVNALDSVHLMKFQSWKTRRDWIPKGSSVTAEQTYLDNSDYPPKESGWLNARVQTLNATVITYGWWAMIRPKLEADTSRG